MDIVMVSKSSCETGKDAPPRSNFLSVRLRKLLETIHIILTKAKIRKVNNRVTKDTVCGIVIFSKKFSLFYEHPSIP